MRRRSFHSSACYTKGNSITSLKVEDNDGNKEKIKPVREVKPKMVAKQVGVTTIARKLLEQNKKPEQKHYKINQLISDCEFLIACYNEIKSKKGNMTKGSDDITLDGIDLK